MSPAGRKVDRPVTHVWGTHIYGGINRYFCI
jgi:hypothetical protein